MIDGKSLHLITFNNAQVNSWSHSQQNLSSNCYAMRRNSHLIYTRDKHF